MPLHVDLQVGHFRRNRGRLKVPGLISVLLYPALARHLSFLCCSLLSGHNMVLPFRGLVAQGILRGESSSCLWKERPLLERDDLEVVLRGSLALVPPQEGLLCHADPLLIKRRAVPGASQMISNLIFYTALQGRQCHSCFLAWKWMHRAIVGLSEVPKIARFHTEPSSLVDPLSLTCRLQSNHCHHPGAFPAP